MKRKIILFLLILLPIRVFAYSDHLIVTGEPIGIEIHSDGVYVVDFYSNLNSSLKKGDKIISINHQDVTSIDDLNAIVVDEGVYSIQIDRNHKILNEKLKVEKDRGVIKTGLYIKDEVDGVGTLSYIDPETKIYASLGHEILESSSNTLFDLKRGTLYEVYDEMVRKNENGHIGEIRVNFSNHILGTIDSNQVNGIYGTYRETLPDDYMVEVGKKDDIQLGDASLYLKMEGEAKEYKINILDIDKNETVKNIYFEIVDADLLDRTGGIVQGMSGSPILQNNKIIGVVNYVVVTHPKTGYGVFIEDMLEEGDKLLQS